MRRTYEVIVVGGGHAGTEAECTELALALAESAPPLQAARGELEHASRVLEAARAGRLRFMDTGSDDYAWWVVRKPGARLAHFIADSKSNKEFVLDLTSGQLVEVS